VSIAATGLQVFSDTEFARRREVIVSSLTARGIDGLIATAPGSLAYIAGDPLGYQRTGQMLGLTAIVLAAGSSAIVVRRFDAESAAVGTPIERVIGYSADIEDPRDPPEVVADVVREAGLAEGRVGIEADLWGLGAQDVERLRALLPKAHLVDASGVVPGAADVKSAEELDVMREAMRFTEAALAAFAETVAPGVEEREVGAAELSAMIRAGSDFPSYQPFVLSGERSTLPHASWGRTLRDGDSVYTELSGSSRRYHAPSTRTAVLGRNPKAEELYEIALAAQHAAVEAIRPGVTTGEVDEACRSAVRRAGRADAFRLRTGYSVGIDWVSRKALSLRPGGTEPLRPGMVFHMPTLLLQPGELGVGVSHTVAVTESGAEVLGSMPDELIRI
jgi:Xaa-Pro dipeptidase